MNQLILLELLREKNDSKTEKNHQSQSQHGCQFAKGEKIEHTARPADSYTGSQGSFPRGLTGISLCKSGWLVSVPFRLLGYFNFCLGLLRVTLPYLLLIFGREGPRESCQNQGLPQLFLSFL